MNPGDTSPFPLRRLQAEDFEAAYSFNPPWNIDRPQPAFVARADAGEVRGRVLDIGCGTGEHALMAAALGLEAVGFDPARTAISKAEDKARQRGLDVRFLVASALDATEMGALGMFDTVLDCGVFHIFDDDDRARFVDNVAAAVPPAGRYFMLCFSERQPGDWGPRRVSEAEIRSSFENGWRIDSIEPSRLVLTIVPEGVDAWEAAITRT
jgi:SAM-dependent methyltransferase